MYVQSADWKRQRRGKDIELDIYSREISRTMADWLTDWLAGEAGCGEKRFAIEKRKRISTKKGSGRLLSYPGNQLFKDYTDKFEEKKESDWRQSRERKKKTYLAESQQPTFFPFFPAAARHFLSLQLLFPRIWIAAFSPLFLFSFLTNFYIFVPPSIFSSLDFSVLCRLPKKMKDETCSICETVSNCRRRRRCLFLAKKSGGIWARTTRHSIPGNAFELCQNRPTDEE